MVGGSVVGVWRRIAKSNIDTLSTVFPYVASNRMRKHCTFVKAPTILYTSA